MWQKLEIRLGHPTSLRPGPVGPGDAGHQQHRREQQQHHHQQHHQQSRSRVRKGPARKKRDVERAAAHRQAVQARLEQEQHVQGELGGGDPPPGLQEEESGAITTANTGILILELDKAVEDDREPNTRSKENIIQLDGHSSHELSCAPSSVHSANCTSDNAPSDEAFTSLVQERKVANRKIRCTFCTCNCGCLWCDDGTGPTEPGNDWQYPDTGKSLDIVICCECHS